MGPGTVDPTSYSQVSISPFNVLFVAKILNPTYNGSELQTAVNGCGTNNIISSRVSIDSSKEEYNGDVIISWDWLLQPFPGTPADADIPTIKGVSSTGLPLNVPATWRGNFYRIAMRYNTTICDELSCDYGAWSPTYSPSFHVSSYFGQINFIPNGAVTVAPFISLILLLVATALSL